MGILRFLFISILGVGLNYAMACTPPPTVNWTGDTDGDWNNSANYDGGSFPDGTERVLVNPDNYTGSGADPVINSNSSFTPLSVLVQNGSSLDINADLSTNSGGVQVTGDGSTISMTTGTLDLNSGAAGMIASQGGVFTLSGGTIECASVIAFSNDGSSDARIDMNAGTINNNGNVLIGVGGRLELSNSNFTGVGGSNTFTMDFGSGILSIEGTNTFPAGFETVTLNDGLIEYVGTSQTIATGFTYFNLGISSGTKTTGADLDINGELTIADGSTLNPGTDNITIAGDWINNSTGASAGYTEGSTTVTFDGSTAQAISHAGGTETFFNLVANNSGGDISLTNNINIDGTLTLTSGDINASAGNITLSSAALLSGGSSSSHVLGTFIHSVPDGTGVTKTYPLGNGSAYRPIDLFVDQGDATARTYSTTIVAGSPASRTIPMPLVRVSSVRHYVITPSSVPTLDGAAVTITYGVDDEVGEEADLRVVKDDGATDWINLGGVGSSSPSGSITSGSFTTFSDFALASTTEENPLPVTLVDFKGTAADDGIHLNWTTATEINNDYFEIQRSRDLKSFSTLDRVKGNGNSNNPLVYTFLDKTPHAGVNYYRLKQVDFDGAFEVFDAIYVDNTVALQSNLTIYPNPVSGQQLIFGIKGVDAEQTLSISISDLSGKQLHHQLSDKGHNTILVNLSESLTLEPGVYLISLQQNGYQIDKRLIIE
ncbi:MAG: T9SS type A sorting domain-containing protein [Cyclobacteriaceae bacterium]